jgi:hypothetical protein
MQQIELLTLLIGRNLLVANVLQQLADVLCCVLYVPGTPGRNAAASSESRIGTRRHRAMKPGKFCGTESIGYPGPMLTAPASVSAIHQQQ